MARFDVHGLDRRMEIYKHGEMRQPVGVLCEGSTYPVVTYTACCGPGALIGCSLACVTLPLDGELIAYGQQVDLHVEHYRWVTFLVQQGRCFTSELACVSYTMADMPLL